MPVLQFVKKAEPGTTEDLTQRARELRALAKRELAELDQAFNNDSERAFRGSLVSKLYVFLKKLDDD